MDRELVIRASLDNFEQTATVTAEKCCCEMLKR